MCGIVGVSGQCASATLLKDCLSKLEYRGYDSFGIATYHDGNFFCEKEHEIKSSIASLSWNAQLKSLPGTTGIAHCRWATHGSPSKENTHPHIDFSKKIYMVHNGIVENYVNLKSFLQKKNINFYSQSDSEILLNWISYHIKNVINTSQLATLITKSLSFVEGKYAIALMFIDHPNTIFATKNGVPLIIGKTNIGSFVSSDVDTLMIHNPQISVLEDNQLAVIHNQDVSFFENGSVINKNNITWTSPVGGSGSHEKGEYPFFMIKEIEEQPAILHNIFQGFCEYKESHIHHMLSIFKEKILVPNIEFLFLGCGSSWHAGLFGKYCFEELARIKTDVEYASEFRYRNPVIDVSKTIGFVVSQSGETADSISAMEKIFLMGIPSVGLVNNPFSEIARKSMVCVQACAGKELGVAATKSFSAQVLILYLISIEMGKIRGHIAEPVYTNLLLEISKISTQVLEIIGLKFMIRDYVKKFFTNKNVSLYLGRGSSMCMALEGALKLKEVSYIHAHGYPAAEIKHGPIALVEENMPIVVLVPPNEPEQSKILSNISEVRSRKGRVIAIYSPKNGSCIDSYCDAVIKIPECTSPFYFSILGNIVLQIIAYEAALLNGINPDRPRNLAKSVTVE